MNDKEFDRYYESLCEICKPLLKYYDIDKTKPYGVYVWTKEEEHDNFGDNLFDIYSDEIVMYDETHEIIEEAKPIIEKIQNKLKEYDKYLELGGE